MNQFFDVQKFPAIYTTPGVTVDYSKHPTVAVDADLVADVLLNAMVEDSPQKCLERSVNATGGAQVLVYPASLIDDAAVASVPRLLAIDIELQLNNQTIPKTDFSFEISMLDQLGEAIAPLTHKLTGNAAVIDGDTRQKIRIIPVEQNNTLDPSTGACQIEDGKVYPRLAFRKIAPAGIALLQNLKDPAFTNAELRSMFPHLREVSAISISIPAGAVTAGVGITVTPVTAGRVEALAQIIDSLTTVKSLAATDTTGSASDGSASFVKKLIDKI